MNKLQRLAIKRIQKLIQEIDIPMTAYAMHRQIITHEDAMAKDQASSKNYSEGTDAQRESVEWTEALLEEEEEE